MDMDTFFVSVERLIDPSLEGKAVIVGGKPFERGVVAGCSRETRIYGVHSAMPLRKAYQLCPHAIFMYGTSKYYSLYSDRVASIIEEEVPLYEKSSIDEFYIDITGTVKVFGDERAWCKKLKQRIYDELHLPLTFGVANCKTVAKIATNVGKKSGDMHIEPGMEAAFLAPLPIRIMPGIGEVTEQALLTLNITTLGQIAALPTRVLTEFFGKHGTSFHNKVRGIDPSQLVPYTRQKSLSSEHTFPEDIDDMELMHTSLKYLSMKIGRELRDKGLLTKNITLKIRDYQFNTVTRARRCDYTNGDHQIYEIASESFRSMYEEGTPIRLIGISTSSLIDEHEQGMLFAENYERLKRLYKGLDWIRDRYGKHAVTYGSALELYGESAIRSSKNAAA
jgi:DNA polymerase IV